MSCPLCERVKSIQEGKYPYLIHEFKNSYLLLGEHQFFEGYSVLVSKNHYREMTDLPADLAAELFQEMMTASRAIEKAFSPKKMNMCSLGNVVDHVHWHFFPRYGNDPQFFDPPWLRMKLFDSARITPAQAAVNIQKIQHSIV
ncbi:MAG: HIT family protein [Bdellovibrionales bacterium]|nr:HIT family protein [Bdellovibrionales bacterium]